jgi:lipopolysaccharide transport system permease protein
MELSHRATPAAMLSALWSNRRLIMQLSLQEMAGKYRASLLGVLWMVLTPLLMLAVFTFVFSTIFQSRWGQSSGSKAEFAIILFAGLAVFNVFSECINRAPGLIVANTNYVKRVVFPLEILPVIALCGALFNFIATFVVWMLAYLVLIGIPPATAWLLPVVMLPFLCATLGLSWLLSALGVYLRDVAQVSGVLVTGLLFLSPIFYPLSAVPERFHWLIEANPLGYVVETVRRVLIFGLAPDWEGFVLNAAGCLLFMFAGFWWFQKTRKGFADVL